MSLKLEKKQKEIIEIYGQQVGINFPTVMQMAKYKELSKQEGFDEFTESIKLLVELGIPQELLNEMPADDFKTLVEYIFIGKKK